ncbi:hypothetical protein AZH51_06920 [Branchiibius sp. NY16-3462-2]|nr:hypothetical protein AZH51_06920 [Branchiibius sp. NY16-3462-2]
MLGEVAGGVLAHVRSVAGGLIDAGHAVDVAAPEGVLDELAVSGMGRVPVRIGERPDPRADASTVRTLRSLRDADVVHAHGVRAGALAALARTGRPLVTTLHNAAPTTSRVNAVLFALLLRVAAHGSAVVLTVSPDLEAPARRAGARDVRRAVIAAPAVAVPAVSHEGFRAVCVGRLTTQKRIDLLIDAAGLVDGVTWSVVGDGPDRAALQAQIDAGDAPVELLGRRDDVPQLLAAADVAVSTAAWEGQPVWLQEAVRAGLPVVAFDVGGIRETIGAAGVFAQFPDVEGIAREVRRLAGDAAYLTSRRAQVRAVADTLPTRRDEIDALIRLYRSLTTAAMS